VEHDRQRILRSVGRNRRWSVSTFDTCTDTGDESSYKIRYADHSPNLDGFSTDALGSGDDKLCAVNPNFYHEVLRLQGGGPVDMGIVHSPDVDGIYNSIAHWNSDGWEKNNTQHTNRFNKYEFGENTISSLNYGDLSFIQYVLAVDECELFIPNVFSPNADDNDVFYIRGNGLESMELIIYNR